MPCLPLPTHGSGAPAESAPRLVDAEVLNRIVDAPIDVVIAGTAEPKPWSESVRLWGQLTGRPIPTRSAAVAEFERSITDDTDLDPSRVEQLVRTVVGATPALGIALDVDWLARCAERLRSAISPWYPIWSAAATYTANWCERAGYPDLIFIARDALPFYAAARAYLSTRAGEDANDAVRLHIGHSFPTPAGRRVVLPAPLPPAGPIRLALMDSGCYGSVAAALVRDHGRDGIAAVHFFSRNPAVFGYLNHLTAANMLDEVLHPNRVRDYIVHAGDTLEAIPKPYVIDRADGHPVLVPSDLISFVLARSVLTDLAGHAKSKMTWTALRAHNDSLCRSFENRESSGLFTGPVPPIPPSPRDLRGLEIVALPPQSDLV